MRARRPASQRAQMRRATASPAVLTGGPACWVGWRHRGGPLCAIQQLAGHADLSTAQRYMHLSPAAIETRFGCSTADRAGVVPAELSGDIVETREVAGGSSLTGKDLVERATGIEP